MKKILKFLFPCLFKKAKPTMYAVLQATPHPGRVLYIVNSIGTTTDIQYAMRFETATLAMQYKIDNPSIAPDFNVSIYPANMFINQ